MKKRPLLVVLTGPTAIGKTSISINLAKTLNTEIISADSRQFYREMSIGTAKPTKKEMGDVPHHFINNLSIYDQYNVSIYENEVLELLDTLFKKNNIIILTGGSGLYIDAVCEGIDELPDPNRDLRSSLKNIFENEGIEPLQKRLQLLDPDYYNIVDKKNSKRLMRAIEVCETSGKKYSELRTYQNKERPFKILRIALSMNREDLYERINQRVDVMISNGLVGEAKSLHSYKHINALNTVGYKELFNYFENKISLEQAITDIKTNTRRYAKRQLTWLKKNNNYLWFNPNEYNQILKSIENYH